GSLRSVVVPYESSRTRPFRPSPSRKARGAAQPRLLRGGVRGRAGYRVDVAVRGLDRRWASAPPKHPWASITPSPYTSPDAVAGEHLRRALVRPAKGRDR